MKVNYNHLPFSKSRYREKSSIHQFIKSPFGNNRIIAVAPLWIAAAMSFVVALGLYLSIFTELSVPSMAVTTKMRTCSFSRPLMFTIILRSAIPIVSN